MRVRLLRYKCPLPPDVARDRLLAFPALDHHRPILIFDEYTDPRLGLHTYAKEKGVLGYYEDGIRKRGGELQTLKVWFRLSVKPCGDGSLVTCLVFSSPWTIFLIALMAAFALHNSFIDPIAASIPLAFSLFFLFLEFKGQGKVVDAIRTLIPKMKNESK